MKTICSICETRIIFNKVFDLLGDIIGVSNAIHIACLVVGGGCWLINIAGVKLSAELK